MTLDTRDTARGHAVRVAGIASLLATAIVLLANYGIGFRLSVPGDAVETAHNIMANETQFRLNVVGDLLYAATLVVVLAALDVILRPVNRLLALVAAVSRLVVVLMWTATALEMLGALRLLGDEAYLAALGTEARMALARLQLSGGYDAYAVGLPFWGLASTVYSYLWLQSRLVPRTLAACGLIASAWCVLSALAVVVLPTFADAVDAYWFDSPMVVFETTLALWLAVKGPRLCSFGAQDPGSTRS